MPAAIVASCLLRCHRCTFLSHAQSCLILSSRSYKTSLFGEYFTNFDGTNRFELSLNLRIRNYSLLLSFRSLYLSIFKSHNRFVNFFFSSRELKSASQEKSTIIQFVTHYILRNHSQFLFAWCTRRILDTLTIVLLSVGFRGDSRKLLAASQK